MNTGQERHESSSTERAGTRLIVPREPRTVNVLHTPDLAASSESERKRTPVLPTTHHADFKLSITKALGDQLAEALTTLTPAPLTEENLKSLRGLPGVYQLRFRGELVYVGKADKSLPVRLGKHLRKLSGRVGIDLEDITFTALYVEEDFSAVAPEKLLINRFSAVGEASWNNNGFGINDPGKERDTTVFDPKHFDQIYPANLDWVIDGLTPGGQTLFDLLKKVKDSLPYTFRFSREKEHQALYQETTVALNTTSATADELFRVISGALPAPWRVVALPGYVILYPNQSVYRSARAFYQRGNRITEVFSTN